MGARWRYMDTGWASLTHRPESRRRWALRSLAMRHTSGIVTHISAAKILAPPLPTSTAALQPSVEPLWNGVRPIVQDRSE